MVNPFVRSMLTMQGEEPPCSWCCMHTTEVSRPRSLHHIPEETGGGREDRRREREGQRGRQTEVAKKRQRNRQTETERETYGETERERKRQRGSTQTRRTHICSFATSCGPQYPGPDTHHGTQLTLDTTPASPRREDHRNGDSEPHSWLLFPFEVGVKRCSGHVNGCEETRPTLAHCQSAP